jgi:aryl-alcohol dehydrogenase-like predicted oxidoreductase
MLKRKLGLFEINPLGLGCMGMSEFYGSVDDERSERVLHRALELSVDHFDTADMYGYGHNETLLGRVLNASGRRNCVVIATKCGIVRDRTDPTRRGIDNSPAYIRESCARSTDRLKTHIDLFYLHRITGYGERIEESMSAMADLLAAGAIAAVGLSEANAATIGRAHRELLRLSHGRHGLSAVQTEYSLMSRDIERNGVLAICRELGIAVVAYSPIGRGLLGGALRSTDDLDEKDFRRTLPRFSKEAIVANSRFATSLDNVAQRLGLSASELAIAWVLHQGQNVLAIPGTTQLKNLERNVAARDIALTADTLQTLDALVQQTPTQGARYPTEVMSAYGLNR